MRSNWWSVLFLSALAVVFARGAHAADGCAEQVARRAQAYYDGVRDVAADFEQTTRSASLAGGPPGETTTSRGRVVFAKPGRMRWSYREPEESLVVTDGALLWVYDPAAKEAQKLHVDENFLSGTAMLFLLGEGDLLREFRVTAPDGCQATPVRLVLQPRTEAPYERLEISVDPKLGEVSGTAVTDLLGNVTRVVFAHVEQNRDPDLSTFRFDPPADVRVLEIPPAP
jgi:outer membrane lipoprotein carrier protein